MFSKKATKFYQIFTVDLMLCSKCQMTVKISSIFVAFLENMNFNQKGMDPIVHYVPTRGNIIAGRLHFKNF